MVGKSVLVIEDDVDSLSAVADLLRDAGHDVITATTGGEALRVLHTGAPLDLIVLDFWLPDMTGHAFLATRTRWPLKLLPVVLMSGDDGYQDHVHDLRQLGVIDVLRKPVDLERLQQAIERSATISGNGNCAAIGADEPELAASEPRSTSINVNEDEPLSTGRRSRRLGELLVRASELLAQTVDVTSHLREVTKLVVPSLADCCMIERAEEGAAQRRLLSAVHADPQQEPELRLLAERKEGLLHAVSQVIERGEPLLYERLDDAARARLADDVDEATLKRLGFDSVIIVPMIARRRVFGAMTWASSGARRRYGQVHLDTAIDLAHRIALALDNDQLHRTTEDALRAREELLALVSHDLRTPLSAIALIASRAAQAGGTALDADAAMTILRNTRRMERMIRDMLDFSQLDAGSLRVQMRKERLPELLQNAVESSRPLASRHTLVCELDDAARELDVLCDRERIMQVLSNLIGHAVRSTPAAGRITVRLRVVDGEARNAVTDTGPGVSAAELPGLFDGFRKSVPPPSEQTDDAGIGLYIARGLVEAHGGRMWVQSEPEHGSTFHFTLRSSDPPPHSAEKASLRPILLVDDDLAFRRELQEILRERGYSVETADNGWQAWSYLQVNAPPSLILLDLMMPVMDGWELHAAIKSHPVLASVPTVIVSCLDRYRIEPSLADAQGYIEKPIRTAQLFDVVQRHVAGPVLSRGQTLRPPS